MTDADPRLKRPVVLVPLALGLLLVLYLALLVFRPFFLDFTVAMSVALLMAPFQRSLTRVFGGRATPAAGALVLLAGLTILVPILSLGVLLSNQAAGFFEWLRPNLQPGALDRLLQETLPARFPWLGDWVRDARLMPLVSDALSRVASGINVFIQRAVTGLTSALLDLLLFLLMLFFLLRDGVSWRAELRHISPLSNVQEEQIFDHLSRTVKGVLQAMALVPLAQGALATIGFWIFGVPSAVLWGVMVVLAALVPILGSPLAWVPACVYLFVNGAHWPALGMLLYGVLVISTIDNVVKPWLLQEAAQIHPMLGFLAILGGILAFGPLGFLVGPVILSLVLSAIKIYRLDILRSPAAPPSAA